MYIVDYFNIFSDYREIYYRNKGIDFHKVKYNNLLVDTERFFKIFFTIYMKHVNLDPSRGFVFVIKKLNNYNDILKNVIETYKSFKIRFIIVNEKYNNTIIDNNKDDFMCQYMLCLYGDGAELISNDKYSDSRKYMQYFLEQKFLNVQTILYRDGKVSTHSCPYLITYKSIQNIINRKISRKSIPKRNLLTVISHKQ